MLISTGFFLSFSRAGITAATSVKGGGSKKGKKTRPRWWMRGRKDKEEVDGGDCGDEKDKLEAVKKKEEEGEEEEDRR